MWSRVRAGLQRLTFVLARRRFDDEAQSEIDQHLDLLAERYRRQGLSDADALAAARRQFGSTTLLREDVHTMNSIGWLDQGAQDLRYAFRQLRANAGFAAVVAATLGLGIGGATAVFSVVQAVLIAPLPYQEPNQLVRLYQQQPGAGGTPGVVAGTHFTFVREHATAFEGVTALANYRETGLDLFADERAERLLVLRVSADYFSVFRTPPQLGRGFDREDEAGARRVVLSDGTWRRHFKADPSIVGTSVRLGGVPYEVAGVAAPGFADPIAPEVVAWIPYALAQDVDPENTSLTVIGRLRAGVSLTAARSELAGLEPAMRARWPNASESAIVALPLQAELVQPARGPLILIFAAAGFVLLLACVNVASLMLVRATDRVHEFAVRAALGSSRWRLARQLLAESLVLASIGAAAGLGLTAVGLRVLERLGRDALPRVDAVRLDTGVLSFAIVAGVVTAIAAGVLPLLRLVRTSPAAALHRQSRSTTESRGVTRLRDAFAIVQIALALTLVAGAAVLGASMYRLQQVPMGFRLDGVLTAEINLPSSRYDEARRASFQETLSDRIAALPGVTAAGGTSRLPATGSYHPWNTSIRTGPLAGTMVERTRFAMQQRVISGDYFAALGIPLLAGRTFDDRDDASAPGRAVVSANFAAAAFPGLTHAAVVGQRIAAGGNEREIIGVVGDVSLDVYGAPTMTVYHAHRQFADDRNWALMQVIASARPPAELLETIRAEVARLDPELVVHRPAALADVVGRGTSRERFALVLMGAFATIGLTLASLGLYGVLAYSVRQRAKEIGIRMALGATATDVRALVFRRAAVIVAIGLPFGLGGALLLGRWLTTFSFGIAPSDPRVLATSAVVLTLVASSPPGSRRDARRSSHPRSR